MAGTVDRSEGSGACGDAPARAGTAVLAAFEGIAEEAHSRRKGRQARDGYGPDGGVWGRFSDKAWMIGAWRRLMMALKAQARAFDEYAALHMQCDRADRAVREWYSANGHADGSAALARADPCDGPMAGETRAWDRRGADAENQGAAPTARWGERGVGQYRRGGRRARKGRGRRWREVGGPSP